MNFPMITRIHTYTKMKSDKIKYEISKVEKTSKTKPIDIGKYLDDTERQTVKMMHDALKPNEKVEITTRVEMIKMKLKAGKELTSNDLAFLKEHAPEVYKQAIAIANERKEYKKELQRCKTKDEVSRVHTRRIGIAVSGIFGSSVGVASSQLQNSPEILDATSIRVNGLSDEFQKFISSRDYIILPWEHEKRPKNKKFKFRHTHTEISHIQTAQKKSEKKSKFPNTLYAMELEDEAKKIYDKKG